MIINPSNTLKDQKPAVLSILAKAGYRRVIDIGGALAPWAKPHVTHYADINDGAEGVTFKGDISTIEPWIKINADTEAHGRFDYAICTQTLEDLRNPQCALQWLPMIAKRGYIDVPNKFMELRKGTENRYQADWDALGIDGAYRGYIHHRWIFSIRDGVLWLYPKLSFLEHVKAIDAMLPPPDWGFNSLSFFWEDTLPFHTWNNDFIGPSPAAVIQAYVTELAQGL